MQARTVFEDAASLAKKKIKVKPEVMMPTTAAPVSNGRFCPVVDRCDLPEAGAVTIL